ncbi:MAG: Crp/Fnr family transcriptional regulator [Thiotrichaceae bacterium]|nr:Crp/Fnr family transcriptional regulator [Thiotrichaceae bacterium]
MNTRAKKTNHQTPCTLCPVRQLGIFQRLPEAEVIKVQQYRSGQCVLPAKTLIYRQGEVHNHLYTMFTGWVMLYKTLSNGSRQILRYVLAGDFLSFQPDARVPMTHSAQTLTETTLCVFPRQNLMQLFNEHPEVAAQITLITARDITLSYEYLVNIGRKNARERLAFLFLEIYHRVLPQFPETGTTIMFPLTQEDIADTVGLTLVHVNRTLRSLREEGLVQLSHHKLTILDYPRLVSLAGFNVQSVLNQPLL